MANIICPFCLKSHTFATSLQCETEPNNLEKTVPGIYMKDYQQVPPLWLVTYGFQGHGKTTYLHALTFMLQHIDKVWPQFSYRPLDQYTIDTIRQIEQAAIRLKYPEPTRKKTPRPLLFSVYDLPKFGSHCLAMYDVAGEIYDSFNEVKEYVAAITKAASTIWFLVSLSDLKTEGKNILELFSTYLSGMEGLSLNPAGRNLIVIYTKGDLLRSQSQKGFLDYLKADPVKGLTRENFTSLGGPFFPDPEYQNSMEEFSNYARDYTRNQVKGGAAFINEVEKRRMNLRFCITSVFNEPDDNQPQRFRVFDPFLWAIILENQGARRRIGLVMDPAANPPAHYSGFVSSLWEELSKYGEVTTYYLGKSPPVSQPGQRASQVPPNSPRQRLIGPILEQAPPESCFIVISMGEIKDLSDFQHSYWQDRLLLVTFAEELRQIWPYSFSYQPDDNLKVIVDTLLHFYEGGN
ncbi:MAG TPA: hypothetical protein VHY08_17845 [Bacillota bacterium]|nr:hypothetical protein [Bacillota bacterium]